MAELRSGWHHGMFGYWRANGTFMPIIAGAAPDDEASGDETSDDEAEEEDEEEEEEELDLSKIKDKDAKLKAEDEKNRRLSRKLRKAEKDAADALKKLKEAEDVKKTDEQKLAERASEAEARVADLEKQIDAHSKQMLLLDNEDIGGLDPKTRKLVLRLIPIDDIEIDEDGDSNIEELVADVKKSAPRLFESSDSSDEGAEEEEETPARRTASPPKKRKKSGDTDRASLEARMPHLAKHR